MEFALAYTSDESRIASALQQGKIDEGDVILITDATNVNYGELAIIDNNSNQVKISTDIRKFNTVDEAVIWANTSKQSKGGKIISVKNGNDYFLYIVNEDKTLTLVNNNGGVVEVDGASIIRNSAGKLEVNGFSSAFAGQYIRVKDDNGVKSLEFYTPSISDEELEDMYNRSMWKEV